MKEVSEEQIRHAESVFYSQEHPLASAESSNWREGAKWMQEQMQPEWISVLEALPEELDCCLFVVDLPHDHRHGNVYGGVYTGDPSSKNAGSRYEFSIPGIGFTASEWMLSPNPPRR